MIPDTDHHERRTGPGDNSAPHQPGHHTGSQIVFIQIFLSLSTAIQVLVAIILLCLKIKSSKSNPDLYGVEGTVKNKTDDGYHAAGASNDNTRAYFKLSNLHYQIGEAEESLAEVRECLKLDPEHKALI